MDSNVIVVIPCFNEAERIDLRRFISFSEDNPEVAFIFVNDGSADDTGRLLDDAATIMPSAASVVHMPINRGKAEAVRQGILTALKSDARYIGYWDADLSTPLDSINEFSSLLQDREDIVLVMGARVQLLGRRVERSSLRHYVGRVFATAASVVLKLDVYDTQCGAKMFRNSETLKTIVANPFDSRWIFDVEILARLATSIGDGFEDRIYEYPLCEWIDKQGSKVNLLSYAKSAIDLARIYIKYR